MLNIANIIETPIIHQWNRYIMLDMCVQILPTWNVPTTDKYDYNDHIIYGFCKNEWKDLEEQSNEHW
jgi:hypothetical protein